MYYSIFLEIFTWTDIKYCNVRSKSTNILYNTLSTLIKIYNFTTFKLEIKKGLNEKIRDSKTIAYCNQQFLNKNELLRVTVPVVGLSLKKENSSERLISLFNCY